MVSWVERLHCFSLASFPIVWEGVYKEPTGTASLNYLSLGVGFVLGLQFCGQVLDIVRSAFSHTIAFKLTIC